jgi:hypothetical protein
VHGAGGDFVWYENPKMSVHDERVYHVQAFWRPPSAARSGNASPARPLAAPGGVEQPTRDTQRAMGATGNAQWGMATGGGTLPVGGVPWAMTAGGGALPIGGAQRAMAAGGGSGALPSGCAQRGIPGLGGARVYAAPVHGCGAHSCGYPAAPRGGLRAQTHSAPELGRCSSSSALCSPSPSWHGCGFPAAPGGAFEAPDHSAPPLRSCSAKYAPSSASFSSSELGRRSACSNGLPDVLPASTEQSSEYDLVRLLGGSRVGGAAMSPAPNGAMHPAPRPPPPPPPPPPPGLALLAPHSQSQRSQSWHGAVPAGGYGRGACHAAAGVCVGHAAAGGCAGLAEAGGCAGCAAAGGCAGLAQAGGCAAAGGCAGLAQAGGCAGCAAGNHSSEAGRPTDGTVGQGEAFAAKLRQLTEMGFDAAEARVALLRAGCNVHSAANNLISGQ